jgi:hypothetical protein
MVTTTLSGFGVAFFAASFVFVAVKAFTYREALDPEIAMPLFACLMCAVLCAYLGGW